jgi:outer membrane protein assembly factor BamB
MNSLVWIINLCSSHGSINVKNNTGSVLRITHETNLWIGVLFMNINARLKWPALFFAIIMLAACTATISPEWVNIFNPKADVEPDRLAWFEDMKVDSYGNVIVAASTISTNLQARVHDLALVKYSPSGQRLWAKDLDLSTAGYDSDDSPEALVLDNQDNAYVLVRQFRRKSEQSSASGTALVSFNSQGDERWRQPLDEDQPMNALTFANDKVYVSGVKTRVFDLSGQSLMTVDHPNHNARSIRVNLNGQFLLGGGSATSLYAASGARLWTRQQADNDYAFGEAIFTMGGDMVAINSLEQNGAAQVIRYSAQGQQLWSREFSAAYQSYGLPGEPMPFEDNRGDLLVTASNAEGHRVAKLDASGRVVWNSRSRKGIISDAALKNGELFVVGDGQNAKYNRDGNRLAESETGRTVQITTGSVAIDGNRLYAGYSARDNGTFALHLSQYIDQ